MDLQEVNTQYGQYIWKMANRYSIGIWSSEDIFSQLLMDVYVNIESGYLYNEQRIISFIITRAINIVRREKRRRFAHFSSFEGEDGSSSLCLTAKDSVESEESEMRTLKEFLLSVLDEKVALFVFELVFPSTHTIEVAMDDVSEHQERLRVLPKHVAKSLYGRPMSGASISIMMATARQTLAPFYDVKCDFKDIVDSILSQPI